MIKKKKVISNYVLHILVYVVVIWYAECGKSRCTSAKKGHASVWKNKGTKRSGRVDEQGGGNVSVEDRTSKRGNKVKRKEERRGQTPH